MALTAEGTALTEADRATQLAIAARAALTAKALWASLGTDNIDASTERWMPLQLAMLQRFYRQSQAATGSYLADYRVAEIGDPSSPFKAPAFDRAANQNALLLAGPARVKLLIGRGMVPDEAHAQAFNKFSGIVRRQVLAGGRMAIHVTTKADKRAVGWRRVSDGNPCTFCAMLVGRGPVYASAERAETVAGTGLEYHGHCGCTAEVMYGEWRPNETEQVWVDAYERAAKQADAAGESRTQESILWRMRAEGSFRDSPKIRNAPSDA